MLPFACSPVAIQFRRHAKLSNMKTKFVDGSKGRLGIRDSPEHQADFHRFYLSHHHFLPFRSLDVVRLIQCFPNHDREQLESS
jgi:hypothetical protein